MNWLTLAAGPLRALPPAVRRTIYTVLMVAGAVLTGLATTGVDTIGSVDVDTLLQVFATLSAATGVVAVANVTPGEDDERMLLDFDEDADLSSFEPVGDERDVFAEPAH